MRSPTVAHALNDTIECARIFVFAPASMQADCIADAQQQLQAVSVILTKARRR